MSPLGHDSQVSKMYGLCECVCVCMGTVLSVPWKQRVEQMLALLHLH